MTEQQCRRAIEAILEQELRIAVPGPETDLLDSGVLDSLSLVDLVAAIERKFDIVVSLIDLDLDDVSTLDSITRFVKKRLG